MRGVCRLTYYASGCQLTVHCVMQKVVRAVFSNEAVKRIKTWGALMNKLHELLPMEMLGKCTDFDEKAATKDAEVGDAVLPIGGHRCILRCILPSHSRSCRTLK